MDRRHFLQIVGAAGLAPALPALPATAAAAPVPTTGIQYAWAAHYAQVHGTVSSARLTAALRVSPAVADSLMHRMAARGVIAAPSVTGIGTATKPFYNPLHLRPTPNNLLRRAKKVADKVRALESSADDEDQVQAREDTQATDPTAIREETPRPS